MSRDATTALLRALKWSAAGGADFEIESIRSRSWASGTFVGARHELVFRLTGATASSAADTFLDGLEERDFDLRGHIVADIALVARADAADAVTISLEALTVEADQA